MAPIRVRQGALSTMPVLDVGEPAWALDDESLWVGTGASNVKIGPFTGSSLPPDASYGGVVVSGTGTVWTVAAGSIGSTALAPITGPALLGRQTGTPGAVVPINVGFGLAILAGDLILNSAPLTDGDKGDLTIGSSGTTFTINTAAITYAKIQNLGALCVFGRNVNSAGVGVEIPAAANGLVLTRDADAISFTVLTTAHLTLAGATDTAKGAIEVAVQSEQETGTDVTRAVTPGRQQFHPSAAKGWVRFDGTAGTISVAAGFNVASLADNGVGDYTVNWTVPFSSANCAAVASSDNWQTLIVSSTAGGVRIKTANSTYALIDSTIVTLSAFGDQ